MRPEFLFEVMHRGWCRRRSYLFVTCFRRETCTRSCLLSVVSRFRLSLALCAFMCGAAERLCLTNLGG